MASLIDDMADHSSASEGEEIDAPTAYDHDFINDGELDFESGGEEAPSSRLKKRKAKPSDKGKGPLDVESPEEQDANDNASLFKKRKTETGPTKAPGGKYAGCMFAVQISDVNSFRQIVAILVQVQTRCSVDGVMFHIRQEDGFSGLEFTLYLDSVLLTGRLKSLPLHVWEQDNACFYVNVADLATQLKHINHDNVCVITKKAGDHQLVINSYATGPNTSNMQQMTLNEPDLLEEHPGHFPAMKYDFDMVLSAPDIKAIVQQASEIGAQAMDVSMFKAAESEDVQSMLQFDAVDEARCKSVKRRFVNFAEKSLDSEGVYNLDTVVDGLLQNKGFVETLKRSYTVETLKLITMSLKNEHQITMSFGAPSIVDDTNEVVPWNEYIAEIEDTSSVDFLADALFMCINLGDDSYIKMLISARVDEP